MPSCEYCGNELELDPTTGRYICTVCYAESQVATFVTSEYDETMVTNRSVGVTKSKKAQQQGLDEFIYLYGVDIYKVF